MLDFELFCLKLLQFEIKSEQIEKTKKKQNEKQKLNYRNKSTQTDFGRQKSNRNQ